MAGQGSGSAAAGFALLLTGTLAMLMMSGGALAATYTVGDDKGWTLPSNGVNYTEWAAKHEFVVGDVLHFEYSSSSHNVQPLPNGASFADCDLKAALVSAITGGSNDITLTTPGGKWYVCGIGQHCQAGMKFKINVAAAASGIPLAPTAETPTPSVPGSASTLAVSSTVVMVAGAVLATFYF